MQLCKNVSLFGARTRKNTAEVESETITSGRPLASLKGSNLNIRRCLGHVTWRGDWDQIRRGVDGNEAQMGSQNKQRKDQKNKC